MTERATHNGHPYDLSKTIWVDGEHGRCFVQYPPAMGGCGAAGPSDDYDDVKVYLVGHVNDEPLGAEQQRPAINPDTGEPITGPEGEALEFITIPAHDDTFARRITGERPADVHGYWVVSAAGANSAKVRTRPRPENSLASAPLAYAVELDGHWRPLTDDETVRRGLEEKLIALEFSNWGGAAWTD